MQKSTIPFPLSGGARLFALTLIFLGLSAAVAPREAAAGCTHLGAAGNCPVNVTPGSTSVSFLPGGLILWSDGNISGPCCAAPSGTDTARGLQNLNNQLPGSNPANILWGDYFYVDVPAGGEPGLPLAGPRDGGPFSPGDYTFYGRYSDGRQPQTSTSLDGAFFATTGSIDHDFKFGFQHRGTPAGPPSNIGNIPLLPNTDCGATNSCGGDIYIPPPISFGGCNGGGCGTPTIANNTDSGQGGGIFNDTGGQVTVTPGTIGGDPAQTGGGLFNNPGPVSITPGTIGGDPAQTGGSTYTVQRGDNLFRIALRHGVTVQELADANSVANANLIFVGQELTIPPASGAGTTTAPSGGGGEAGTMPNWRDHTGAVGIGAGGTPIESRIEPRADGTNRYTVQAGDTLSSIARRAGTTERAIAQVNGIANTNSVFVGQDLIIPPKLPPATSNPGDPIQIDIPERYNSPFVNALVNNVPADLRPLKIDSFQRSGGRVFVVTDPKTGADAVFESNQKATAFIDAVNGGASWQDALSTHPPALPPAAASGPGAPPNYADKTGGVGLGGNRTLSGTGGIDVRTPASGATTGGTSGGTTATGTTTTATGTTATTPPVRPTISGTPIGTINDPLMRGTEGKGDITRIDIITGPDGKPHAVGTGEYAGWDFGEAKQGSAGNWRPEGGRWTPPPPGWQPGNTTTGTPGPNNLRTAVSTSDVQTAPAPSGPDAGFYFHSDRRLKTDIVRIGALPSGLPVYSYRYLWSSQRHVGVMAQEALRMFPGAVREIDGFLAVDYSRIR